MTRRRRIEHTPLLDAQRADPIVFLRERGLELAPSLGIKPRIIVEGVGLVVDLLGEEWLRGELGRSVPALRGAQIGHRMVQAFKTGDQRALVDVLELGLYAKHLARCAGFEAVVPALRDKYKSALLQLATAYRIMRHGPLVTLEPRAAGGRLGDIAFRWSGRNYLVECYARQERRDPIEDVLVFTSSRILDLEACRDRRLRVRVRLDKVPTDDERLELEREARRLCAATLTGTNETTVPAGHIAVDALEANEEPDLGPGGVPLDSGPYGDAHHLFVESQMSEAELLKPMNPLDERLHKSRVLLWRPPGTQVRREERVSQFADLVEQKLAQTRPEQGRVGRIVVAQLLDGDVEATRDEHLLRAVQGRLVRNHDDVAAIIVCARVTLPSHRPAYVGTVAPGRTHDAIADAWPRWALDTDHRRDLLADWNREHQ